VHARRKRLLLCIVYNPPTTDPFRYEGQWLNEHHASPTILTETPKKVGAGCAARSNFILCAFKNDDDFLPLYPLGHHTTSMMRACNEPNWKRSDRERKGRAAGTIEGPAVAELVRTNSV
jgi:hypothetical protein